MWRRRSEYLSERMPEKCHIECPNIGQKDWQRIYPNVCQKLSDIFCELVSDHSKKVSQKLVQSWQKGRLQSKIFSGSVLSATQLATDGTPKKGARQRLVCDMRLLHSSGRSSSLHKSFEKGKIMMLWACLGYPSKTWKGLKGTGKGRFFSCFWKEFTYVFKIFTGKVKGKGTAVMVKFTANWIPKLHGLRLSFITYVLSHMACCKIHRLWMIVRLNLGMFHGPEVYH